MITLRLDPNLEHNINTVAKQLGVSKSELIRKSIIDFINKLDKPSPWKLGEDLFGQYTSNSGDLSVNRKALIKEKIKAKQCEKF